MKTQSVDTHPEASQDELDVLFVKYHDGEELATRFQAYLQQRKAHRYI